MSQYYACIREDEEQFENAPVVYENSKIVVVDAGQFLPPMKQAWPQRELSKVHGLFVHHKGNSWVSYLGTNRYVCNHRRPNTQNRFAYHLGVHHDPPTVRGKIKVYQFNALTDASWASGSKGADTKYWQLFGGKHVNGNQWSTSANANTIAINLNGYFSSKHHPENLPKSKPNPAAAKKGLGHKVICQPSTAQLLAVLGVIDMCKEVFPNFDDTAIFGHKDTGKGACPGDLPYAFVEAARSGQLTSMKALDSWIAGADLAPLKPGDPDNNDLILQTQRMLVVLGYDLGPYGPNKDGVDGQWGGKSIKALMDFEEEQDLLVNGEPSYYDLETLRDVAKAC